MSCKPGIVCIEADKGIQESKNKLPVHDPRRNESIPTKWTVLELNLHY